MFCWAFERLCSTACDWRSKAGGGGISTYEVVPPGQIIEFDLTIPTKGPNCPSLEEWGQIIRRALEEPVRSMSPARGTATGKMVVLSIDRVERGRVFHREVVRQQLEALDAPGAFFFYRRE